MTRSQLYRRFMATLSIRDKHAHIVPFRFNEAQQVVWEEYLAPALDADKPIRLIILKARQMGISTLIQGLLFTRFVLENWVNIKVIAHEGESTKEIWGMAERMADHHPVAPFIRKVGKTMHSDQAKFSCATAGSPHATRSMNITALHLSEVAFWVQPEAWLAALQTVQVGGRSWIFVESTANGMSDDGALFYDEWVRAAEGHSRFQPLFLPWFRLSDYALPNYVYAEDWDSTSKDALVLEDLDAEETELHAQFGLTAGQLAWRRDIIAEKCKGNVEDFHQEYPSTAEEAFIQSGLPLFSSRQLLWFKKDIRPGERFVLDGTGRFVRDPSGYIELWQPPEPGHSYIIGADTSMGINDNQHSKSAAEIIDVDTLEQVGEYEASSPNHVMARHLAVLARRYNDAMLAPEVTASGGGGGRELLVHLRKDQQYYHIYRYKHVDHLKHDPGRLLGWETNVKTRPRMIDRIIEAITERACLIHSTALLKQLHAFGESDSMRFEALSGRDDLLFAWGIALAVRSEEYPRIKQGEREQTKTEMIVQRAGIAIKKDLQDQFDDEWERRFQSESNPEGVSWQAL